MTNAQTEQAAARQPLRLWPGAVAVMLQWLLRFGIPAVVPGAITRGNKVTVVE